MDNAVQHLYELTLPVQRNLVPDLVNLGCRNCGAKLAISQTLERFACGYCGVELIVTRSGGTVSLTLVEETTFDQQIESADREIADGETASRGIEALRSAAKTRCWRGEVGDAGCLSSIVWGALLIGILSGLFAFAGVLIGIVTVVAIDILFLVWTMKNDGSLDEQLRAADFKVQGAQEKAAWRVEAMKDLTRIEPSVLALRKQVEEKRRIADS